MTIIISILSVLVILLSYTSYNLMKKNENPQIVVRVSQSANQLLVGAEEVFTCSSCRRPHYHLTWHPEMGGDRVFSKERFSIGDVNEARALSADNSGVLPERDQQILEFERQWWKFAGAKEQAIREQFDMSATRYYQVLNALIDQPEALAFDPMLVKRLQRMRAARQRARSARRLGIELKN